VLRRGITGETTIQGYDLTSPKQTYAAHPWTERTCITHLIGVDLTYAFLYKANLCDADLASAKLIGTNFCRARLCNAHLGHADLRRANLDRADLTGADLSDANLELAILVQTTVEGTSFAGARVYGVSVWDLKGSPKDETDLVVTPPDQPTVTVGDLEVAQFVYLLLNNAKIRDVIDTVTAKAVLILGRFTDERKQILDAIRDRLSAEDYVPIIFDFDKPATRNLTETISTLAHLARFIIADITDPKSIPQELMKIIPQLPSVPVQPILLEGKQEWPMFEDLRRTGRILATFHYQNLEDVHRSLRENLGSRREVAGRVLGGSGSAAGDCKVTRANSPAQSGWR
jgi:uncharacterized protein YjbI with pentapeptide repeats